MAADAFDRMTAEGRAALLAGRHRVETPPAQSGRWGPSVVLLPGSELASRLDALTGEIADVAGAGHWRSGGAGRAHVTVRALEAYTEDPIPAGRARRYVRALEAAAKGIGPVTLELEGVALSPGVVLVRSRCPDGAADDLRRRLGRALGADGWLEDAHFEQGRDPVWYCSLLHLAGPVGRPEAVVAWAASRVGLPIGREVFTSVALCRWVFDGEGMAPTVVGAVALDR